MPSEAISKVAARLQVSAQRPGRLVLFLYMVLVLCPIRYWPMDSGVDPTWRYALNYAASLGSQASSEVVFSMGPLSYLTFPQLVGDNLTRALLFQGALWLVLTVIMADLFFRSGFRLRNLVLFSFCVELAAPMFWFDSAGVENLILFAALILMVLFQLRGSWFRYLAALVLVGFLPLLKLSAAIVGLTAVAGLVLERVIHRRPQTLTVAAAAVLVPAAVATAVSLSVMPSFSSVVYYVRGSLEIVNGYSAALSLIGPPGELWWAGAAVLVIAAALWLQADRRLTQFLALLLVVPLFVSFKHGFVRQDVHIINFFCFVALALALIALAADKVNAFRLVPCLAVFFVVWQNNVSHNSFHHFLTNASGGKNAALLVGLAAFDQMKPILEPSMETFPENTRIEPELAAIIGTSPVAPLSNDFTNVAVAGLHLVLTPVVQRYAAYTPYLDNLNAVWIRDRGPAFLLFDGTAIDRRNPWAETPATWLEIYRWYDTRLQGPRNLLLERRAIPRFKQLETIQHFSMPFSGELQLPASEGDVFWTRTCSQSTQGRLEKLLFRQPSVSMSIHETSGHTRSARMLPGVMVAPVMGNYLPSKLSQFSVVFARSGNHDYAVDKVFFEPAGSDSYAATCDVELLRPVQ